MSPIVAGSAGAGAVTSATGIPLASVAVANGAAAAASGAAGTALVPIADAGVATAPLGSSWMAPRIPPQL